ncbi:S8/S53 family peptidase [Enhygromyxa salina]|uniref:Subtilase family protein n=1 Tax=Enhygromyxa salina TaxID=215803 RepID=A0A2S9YXC9_9BACT|nr:S8/S53 family peptidase [Enhygromyxa salina]PRQ09755.1 Subtilase family protein [Enhygromyxa salina]
MTADTRLLRILAPLLTLTALACDEVQPGPVEEILRDVELVDAACPTTRQIAIKQAKTCPAAANWVSSKLFPGAVGVLGNYCVYTWNGAPEQENVADLTSIPSLVAVGSDCEAVFEQGEPNDALWTELNPDILDLFHAAIGWTSSADLDLPSSEASRWPVVVAVLDSVPEPAPYNPHSDHGEIMVRMVEDIACPDPLAPCAVDVVRGLAMPRIAAGQVDLVKGGFFGSQGDVARSIYAAVDDWDTTDWNGLKPKLILSLSLGWEPEFGELATDSPAVAAVHTALEYASCHGAIIIAAAGNQGHLCSTGPLLPGAWEQHPAPDAARCAALGAPIPAVSAAYRPLLYSIGGLDHDLAPMPRTREDGMPRLASSATHAVGRGDSTAVTGTSAAAATAAGAAALVWSYNKNMNASRVMQVLYESGVDTTMTADYVGPTNETDVMKIDVCAALDHACDLPGSNCPAQPFANTLACVNAPPIVSLGDLFNDLASVIPDFTRAPSFGPATVCPASCGYPLTGYFATSQGACPTQILPELPYTEPQPTEIGCPNCTLDVTSSIVYAALDPEYNNATLRGVAVTVFDGAAEYYFDIGPVPLNSNTITTIQLDPALMPVTVVSSSISLTFVEYPRDVSNDLLIN